jgi:hypothetical protein
MTDRMDGAWRVLTVHTLAEELRKGKWEEATTKVTEREVTVDTYRIVESIKTLGVRPPGAPPPAADLDTSVGTLSQVRGSEF